MKNQLFRIAIALAALSAHSALAQCVLNCNGGFEQPGGVSSFQIFNQASVPCWKTTAQDQNIELWTSGFMGVNAFAGNQFAELNAYYVSTLYTDVNTPVATTLNFSFAHLGRLGIDSMAVEAGPPGGPYTVLGKYGDSTVTWGFYSGTYNVNSNQPITRFRFVSIYASGGDPTFGNFLDSVTIQTSLNLQTSSFNSACGQNTGSATANASGGTGSYSYSWSNGALTAGIQNLSAGSYTVTVTDNGGCSKTASVTITGGSIPSVDLSGGPQSACGNVCVNFAAIGNGVSYSWNFGDGSSGQGANPSHCYTKPGTYHVSLTLTDVNGCSNTKTKNSVATVWPLPVADFTANPQPATVLSPTIHFTDQSTGATNWSWNFGDSQNASSTLQNPSYTSPDTGCYNVSLVVENQYGCKDSVEKPVCIQDQYSFYVPNAFTPNADGLNDGFRPEGYGLDTDQYLFSIYDRWGNMIWETRTWTEGWDGRANGGKDIAQMDVYVWKIKTVEKNNGALHRYVGHVTLIR